MEHKARPPARFSAPRSPKNTTIHPLEYAKTLKMHENRRFEIVFSSLAVSLL